MCSTHKDGKYLTHIQHNNILRRLFHNEMLQVNRNVMTITLPNDSLVTLVMTLPQYQLDINVYLVRVLVWIYRVLF